MAGEEYLHWRANNGPMRREGWGVNGGYPAGGYGPNSRKEVPLPEKFRCYVCDKIKALNLFSKKEHLSYQNKVFVGNRPDPLGYCALKCRVCAGAPPTEMKCCGPCDMVKSLDEFSKSQRLEPVIPWCLLCIDWKLGCEPGVTKYVEPYGVCSPDEVLQVVESVQGECANGLDCVIQDRIPLLIDISDGTAATSSAVNTSAVITGAVTTSAVTTHSGWGVTAKVVANSAEKSSGHNDSGYTSGQAAGDSNPKFSKFVRRHGNKNFAYIPPKPIKKYTPRPLPVLERPDPTFVGGCEWEDEDEL